MPESRPVIQESDVDAERWSDGRAEFNAGWAETIAKVNRDRERGEGPFALPRPGWDEAQRS